MRDSTRRGSGAARKRRLLHGHAGPPQASCAHLGSEITRLNYTGARGRRILIAPNSTGPRQQEFQPMGAELTDSSRNSFRTHEPANLVPDLSGYNLYSTDLAGSRPSPGRAGSRGRTVAVRRAVGQREVDSAGRSFAHAPPRIECLRSAGAPHRSGGIPPGLACGDAPATRTSVGDAAVFRPPSGGLGRVRRGIHDARPARTGFAMPGLDDLRQHSGAAKGTGAVRADQGPALRHGIRRA